MDSFPYVLKAEALHRRDYILWVEKIWREAGQRKPDAIAFADAALSYRLPPLIGEHLRVGEKSISSMVGEVGFSYS